ncbi:hypothetical protein RF11_14907 [Thelohanellus kitauei]|uniref:Uncharacterized protein n=1 Tax=Thelohanellus kitauei TaxID=669202 RepID=A0A0C2MFL3_THEKT|nr:hypothetical protein RF11_14907 [Thelohanellus kitauei]
MSPSAIDESASAYSYREKVSSRYVEISNLRKLVARRSFHVLKISKLPKLFIGISEFFGISGIVFHFEPNFTKEYFVKIHACEVVHFLARGLLSYAGSRDE